MHCGRCGGLEVVHKMAWVLTACALAAAPPPPVTKCGVWQNGTGLIGRQIGVPTECSSAAECCAFCKRTPRCTGWTWNLGNHLCYAKNGVTGNKSQPSVSGHTGDGPPLPVPPPSPPPPLPPGAPCSVDPPGQCPWYNASLTIAERSDALVAAMTVAEKLSVLAGAAVSRLHVIADGFNEALHGVAWSGRATVFPCPMSLGATWNSSLVNAIGAVVAHEALAKHWSPEHSNALSFFAPNINIVRDIRWGRAQETYGEDPTLTGELGAAYVRGMQNPVPSWPSPAVRNVAKHFAAYNLESDFAGRVTPASVAKGVGQYRLGFNAIVSDADMLQTFLPAFESVVIDADIRGVMCAYNAVNGVPLCANDLMRTQLRGCMNFSGIVVTDCGAIGFMTSNHHWNHSDGTPYTSVEATAAALAAGTDLNCGSSYGSHLPTAFRQGLVTEDQIDAAVGRALRGHMELGLFQDSVAAAADPRRQVSMSVVDSAPHRALAKLAAVEGVVLLKNDAGTLPLGGVGMSRASSRAAAGYRSAWARWPASRPIRVAVVGPNANRTLTLTSNYAGCKDHPGGPILSSCTFVNPLQGIRASAAASAGRFDSDVSFAQGVEVDTPATDGIAEAVAVAQAADVTVVVGGLITCQEIGPECQEAEARDRSTPVDKNGLDDPFSTTDIGRDYGVGLPGKQLDLLQAVANASRAPVVLVVMSGSAVAVPWAAASPRVGAIVQHFYGGVLGGEALADVLFGAAAPAGRLPVTVPFSEAQLPADYFDMDMSAPPGRTHRYFSGTSLYPFGFGLGYSTFAYSGLALSRSSVPASDGASRAAAITVTVTVANKGEFSAGSSDEVVEVYATPDELDASAAAAPPMSVPRQTLAGFARVSVPAGGSVTASVVVPLHRLRLVGPDGTLALLPGAYTLHVGGRAPGASPSASVPEPLTATLKVLP